MIPALPPKTAKPALLRRRWGRRVLVVLLAGIATLGWREFTWQRAVRQLGEVGFYEDRRGDSLGMHLWKTARSDWRQLFKAGTWKGEPTVWRVDQPTAGQLRNFDAAVAALRRVNPEIIHIEGCPSLQNLNGLRGLSALRKLYLDRCHALENVDGLQGCVSLEHLWLFNCTVLRDVNGLRDHPALQELLLRECPALENAEAIGGLTSLRECFLVECTALRDVGFLSGLARLHYLDLSGCSALENVNGVAGLVSLRTLYLKECAGLRDVGVLSGLPQLQRVGLKRSTRIPPEQVEVLKVALSKTRISFHLSDIE